MHKLTAVLVLCAAAPAAAFAPGQALLPRAALSRIEDWHFEEHAAREMLYEQLKVR